MESIAVTKPDTGVLSRKRLTLSPFGALAQVFLEELLTRAGLEEGRYPFVPLDFLEEENAAVPAFAQTIQPVIQVDLNLVLEALRQTESKTEQERITERIVERIIHSKEQSVRSAPEQRTSQLLAPVPEQGAKPPHVLERQTGRELLPALEQNFYSTLSQHIHFSANLRQRDDMWSKTLQASRRAAPGGLSRDTLEFLRQLQMRRVEGQFRMLPSTSEWEPFPLGSGIRNLPRWEKRENNIRRYNWQNKGRIALEEFSYSADGESRGGGASNAQAASANPLLREAEWAVERISRKLTAEAESLNVQTQEIMGQPLGQAQAERQAGQQQEQHPREEQKRTGIQQEQHLTEQPQQRHTFENGSAALEEVAGIRPKAISPDSIYTIQSAAGQEPSGSVRQAGAAVDSMGRLPASAVRDIRTGGDMPIGSAAAPEGEAADFADFPVAVPGVEITYRTSPEGTAETARESVPQDHAVYTERRQTGSAAKLGQSGRESYALQSGQDTERGSRSPEAREERQAEADPDRPAAGHDFLAPLARDIRVVGGPLSGTGMDAKSTAYPDVLSVSGAELTHWSAPEMRLAPEALHTAPDSAVQKQAARQQPNSIRDFTETEERLQSGRPTPETTAPATRVDDKPPQVVPERRIGVRTEGAARSTRRSLPGEEFSMLAASRGGQPLQAEEDMQSKTDPRFSGTSAAVHSFLTSSVRDIRTAGESPADIVPESAAEAENDAYPHASAQEAEMTHRVRPEEQNVPETAREVEPQIEARGHESHAEQLQVQMTAQRREHPIPQNEQTADAGNRSRKMSVTRDIRTTGEGMAGITSKIESSQQENRTIPASGFETGSLDYRTGQAGEHTVQTDLIPRETIKRYQATAEGTGEYRPASNATSKSADRQARELGIRRESGAPAEYSKTGAFTISTAARDIGSFGVARTVFSALSEQSVEEAMLTQQRQNAGETYAWLRQRLNGQMHTAARFPQDAGNLPVNSQTSDGGMSVLRGETNTQPAMAPDPVELAYNTQAQTQGTGGAAIQSQAPSGEAATSDFVRSLPGWVQRYLQESAPQAPACPGMAVSEKMSIARNIAALPDPEQGRTFEWTAPDYPAAAPVAYRERVRQQERQPQSQNIRISEAEIRRTADRVYQIIEDRIRRERRRLGL